MQGKSVKYSFLYKMSDVDPANMKDEAPPPTRARKPPLNATDIFRPSTSQRWQQGQGWGWGMLWGREGGDVGDAIDDVASRREEEDDDDTKSQIAKKQRELRVRHHMRARTFGKCRFCLPSFLLFFM